MTGHALFNEVFIDEARVRHDHIIGDLNDGWRVANTTLMVERSSIGGESVAAPSAAIAGTIAGHLDRAAGSFGHEVPVLGGGAVGPGRVRQLMTLANDNGSIADPTIRQDLIRLHSMIEITGWHIQRMKSGNAATGAEGNLAKLRNSNITRLARNVGCSRWALAGQTKTVILMQALRLRRPWSACYSRRSEPVREPYPITVDARHSRVRSPHAAGNNTSANGPPLL